VTVSTVEEGVGLVGRAERIATEVAARHADDVDRRARFPAEAIEAIRTERLLSALVPRSLGGEEATLPQVAEATFCLARACASTAMVFAMHQLQVACLVRHGTTPALRDYLRDVVEHQLLIASATTERGVGGDTGASVCAVETSGGRFALEKLAPVISYGEQADAILLTARRTPDSAPHDQVMVLCTPPGLRLEPTNGWEAMGFRGTCSSGFRVVAEGDETAVLPQPFDVIAGETNVPVAHVLWAHVWLGIAAEATWRARAYVQAEARKHPGGVPAPARGLAQLDALYLQMAALVRAAAERHERLDADGQLTAAVGYTTEMNALKVTASTMVVRIVGEALGVCGMAGYREDSPYRMGRLLRDAHGAPLMINNDRLLDNNARLLLVDRRAP